MAYFDTILIPCPCCGRQETVQTKAGPKLMKRYKLEELAPEVAASIAGMEIECQKCGIVYTVKDMEAEAKTFYQTIILRKER